MSLFGYVNEQSLQAILITLGFKVNEKYAYFHGEIANVINLKARRRILQTNSGQFRHNLNLLLRSRSLLLMEFHLTITSTSLKFIH